MRFVQSLMITQVTAEKDETKNKPENQSVIPSNFILLRSWLFEAGDNIRKRACWTNLLKMRRERALKTMEFLLNSNSL